MKPYDWSCKHDIMIRNPDGSLTPMDEPWYQAEKIAPDTWKVFSSGDYSYLLAGNGEAMLIDSGYGAGNIRAYCEDLCGLPVRWIANTHEHFDHTANNGYFDLAFMTAACRERATIPFESFSGVSFPRDYPVRIVQTGSIIPLPGRPLEVFQLPDHAPGSACYLDAKARILFTGDEIWENKPLRSSTPAAYAGYLQTIADRRDEYDVLWGGTGRHEKEVIDKLLTLCREAAAGETGDPYVPLPNTTGHWHEILPDGTLVYDRLRPHSGDGSKGRGPAPDPATLRQLTLDGVTLVFDPGRL